MAATKGENLLQLRFMLNHVEIRDLGLHTNRNIVQQKENFLEEKDK